MSVFQVTVFEHTCLNAKYLLPEREGEKASWKPENRNKDRIPVITSARKFTDYCTLLRLRDMCQRDIMSLIVREIPFYNDNKRMKWFENLRKGL